MKSQQSGSRVMQSAGAVLAGLLAIVVLSIATDMVMHLTGVFPPMSQPMPDPMFLLPTSYRVVIGVLGGYLSARLAPYRPMTHAMVLGCIGVAVSIAGAVATWNAGPEFGPKWYPLALVVTALPSVWLGAKLVTRKRGTQST